MEEEEDSQADGFVVDDGYLSEGEGGPIDNDDFGAEVEGSSYFAIEMGTSLMLFKCQGVSLTCFMPQMGIPNDLQVA